MKKDTKPSEILKALYVASQDRYSAQDIDTRQIASITNVVMKIGEILDEQEKAIQALRIVGGGENEEKR